MRDNIVRNDARRSGDMVRYAGWPVIVPQTNAHHTWNVLRILVTIWPTVPNEVWIAGLYHDAGELGAGDIPFPNKMLNADLKSVMDRLEEESLAEQGVVIPPFSAEWKVRLKTADLIEMLEKGMDERSMGNRYALPIIERICEVLERREADGVHSTEDRIAIRDYLRHRWNHYSRVLSGGKVDH